MSDVAIVSEFLGQAAQGRSKQEIGVPLVFERNAKLRALYAESRQGLARGRLMPLLVHISDELFDLNSGVIDVMQGHLAAGSLRASGRGRRRGSRGRCLGRN